MPGAAETSVPSDKIICFVVHQWAIPSCGSSVGEDNGKYKSIGAMTMLDGQKNLTYE
jgi:hypothetical protein